MVTLQSQPSVRFVEVAPEYEGQRIDNFLLRTLKGVPKSRVYRILRDGQVRVNRSRIKPDYRLQVGDVVRIPPLRMGEERIQRTPPASVLKRLRDAILLEDRHVIVLNKPAGIAVHKGSGVDFGVIEALRCLRPEAEFLELAHRLDRETSGCLVLAKTPDALRMIHAALHAGTADKRYLVLVRGSWSDGAREVTVPLRKNALRGGERMVEPDAAGKAACSRFSPISVFRQASFLEVRIATGRTHQIRVHAAYIHHPVAGDSKYGDTGFNKKMSRLGLNRLFLHAHSLNLPLETREISVSAPLEDDLRSVLEGLETRP